MLLIQNVKEHKAKDGKTYKTFSVLGDFENFPVEVKGWRFFDESGEVKPPSMKTGAFWSPTFVSPEEFLEAVERAFRSSYLGESLEDYETASKAWRAFTGIMMEGEERVNEFYSTLLEQTNLTPAAQIVRMLLEVVVNPETFINKKPEDLFRVGGGE